MYNEIIKMVYRYRKKFSSGNGNEGPIETSRLGDPTEMSHQWEWLTSKASIISVGEGVDKKGTQN